jgi:hypothetical protein
MRIKAAFAKAVQAVQTIRAVQELDESPAEIIF